MYARQQPDGWNGNGPETPLNGIDANPAGYSIASAADLGKGGPYMAPQSPFDQMAYDENYKQVIDRNNSSLPVKLAGFAKNTPLGSLVMGGMGLIDKATGGLYGNGTYSEGSNPNYGGSTSGQGSSFGGHNSEGGGIADKTYATKEEFADAHKKLSPEKLEKRWQEYLKKHPQTGTGTTTASAGPVGAAYSIATSKGNYIVDSRGNYFMMGPDRSYIQVPPPQGAVA
jgi:hypothetical protein